MIIDKNSIEELKNRVNILDLISSYVEVKKNGSSYVCICPFHDDKNPSMHINNKKGFYHCFACKAGGDIFRFVQDYDKIDFNEAVQKIANIYKFTLNYTNTKKYDKNIYQILPILNSFYIQNLYKYPNILKYLYNRGLDDNDIKNFNLGFAPSSNETLRLIKNENIELKNALDCGAIKTGQNDHYASFINRITFPIYDHKDNLIGFGGRSLDEKNMAKYVNSPQSKIFDKSRVFYAINYAKKSIENKKEVIICEGYMDAIALHKAGFDNTVAVLGTALTNHHIPLIKKYEARVILLFDNDNAGYNAAFKSAFLLSINQIDGKVAMLKDGKDAAELLAKNEINIIQNAIKEAIELGEFYIRSLANKSFIDTPLSKQKLLKQIQEYTFLLEPLVADSYVSLVAKILNTTKDMVVLSKNKKIPTSIKKTKNNYIIELEILYFLKNNLHFKDIFYQFSDELYFTNKALLEKILNGFDINDPDIREFELINYDYIKDENSFLIALSKLYLHYLNNIPNINMNLAFKKQILSILNQNIEKLNNNLAYNVLNKFLKEYLTILKLENDSNKLNNILKKTHKIFSNKNLNVLDTNNKGPF